MLAVTASDYPATVVAARYSGAQDITEHKSDSKRNGIINLAPLSSPLPIVSSGPPYQMLDLKLALYLPFLNAMEPGVFIAASDTIEVFCPKNVRD